MKKLSKLVALLLVGAMAMLMLTACGGGGGNAGGENTQAEDAYIKAVNANRTTSALSNNQELKERANKLLGTAVDISTGQFTGKAKVDIDAGLEKTVVTAVTRCTYSNQDLNDFLSSISFDNQNVDVKVAGLWTNVGVVVKTIKGQTYIAVSVEISNPFFKK